MIIILIEAVTQSDQLSVSVLHSMKANISRPICTCSVTFSFALHTVHTNKCNAVFHPSQFCLIGPEFSLSRHLRGFCKKAFQEYRWLWFHQSLQTHQWVKSLQLVKFIIFALQADYLQQLLWNILSRPPLPPLPFRTKFKLWPLPWFLYLARAPCLVMDQSETSWSSGPFLMPTV